MNSESEISKLRNDLDYFNDRTPSLHSSHGYSLSQNEMFRCLLPKEKIDDSDDG